MHLVTGDQNGAACRCCVGELAWAVGKRVADELPKLRQAGASNVYTIILNPETALTRKPSASPSRLSCGCNGRLAAPTANRSKVSKTWNSRLTSGDHQLGNVLTDAKCQRARPLGSRQAARHASVRSTPRSSPPRAKRSEMDTAPQQKQLLHLKRETTFSLQYCCQTLFQHYYIVHISAGCRGTHYSTSQLKLSASEINKFITRSISLMIAPEIKCHQSFGLTHMGDRVMELRTRHNSAGIHRQRNSTIIGRRVAPLNYPSTFSFLFGLQRVRNRTAEVPP